MTTQIMKIESSDPNRISNLDIESEIPEGDYGGIWSGYEVKFLLNGIEHTAHTKEGVRGINIPCVVSVRFGVAIVR